PTWQGSLRRRIRDPGSAGASQGGSPEAAQAGEGSGGVVCRRRETASRPAAASRAWVAPPPALRGKGRRGGPGPRRRRSRSSCSDGRKRGRAHRRRAATTRAERRTCGAARESDPLAAAELQVHIERKARILLGEGVHIVQQQGGIPALVVNAARRYD